MGYDHIEEQMLIDLSRLQRQRLSVAMYGDIVIRQHLSAQAYRFARDAFEQDRHEEACMWQKIAAMESSVYLKEIVE